LAQTKETRVDAIVPRLDDVSMRDSDHGMQVVESQRPPVLDRAADLEAAVVWRQRKLLRT
jgi:hypothetical protein